MKVKTENNISIRTLKVKAFKNYLILAVITAQLLTVNATAQSNNVTYSPDAIKFITSDSQVISSEKVLLHSVIEDILPSNNLLQEYPATISWVRQFYSVGSESSSEKAYSIAADSSGNIIIAGSTGGNLFGMSYGGVDAFVAKYNTDGKEIWGSQFGTTGIDVAVSVAIDAAGNIFIAGYSSHYLLNGKPYSEGLSTFVRKCDSNGKQIWTIQFGLNSYDELGSIALDSSGNIYIAGSKFISTNGRGPDYMSGFLSKYNSDGSEIWTRVFEYPDSSNAKAVATGSSGEVYVAGQNVNLSSFPAGDIDPLLRRYNSEGIQFWARRSVSPSANESVNAVTVDLLGNIYVVGYSNLDAFLSKYDANGNQVWNSRFGSYGGSDAFSVFTDITGNIYVAGYNNIYTSNIIRAQGDDAFVRKYASSGYEIWNYQFGTNSRDVAYSLVIDKAGNIYVAGTTEGAFPGYQYPRGTDAFLLKLIESSKATPPASPTTTPTSPAPVPEPLPLPPEETPPPAEQPPTTEPPPSESDVSQV